MKRLNLREQVLSLLFLLLLQLPLIYKVILFDHAISFFYVGFLLFLPTSLNRIYLMLIGFVSGLMVDVFTNTPGLHALSCVIIMYLRNFWLAIVDDDWFDIGNINFITLKPIKFFGFIFPLVLVHHSLLFLIENGGFHLFGIVFQKIALSSIFSTAIIFAFSLLTSSRSASS